MLKIIKNKMDNVALGQTHHTAPELLTGQYHIEFKRDARGVEKVVTISAENIKQFMLEDLMVDTESLSRLLEHENPLVEMTSPEPTYIFPCYNLVLWPDFTKHLFRQVLIYDDSLRNLYEEGLLTYQESVKRAAFSDEMDAPHIFIPYRSIGNFTFGMDIQVFCAHFNLEELPIVKKKELISLGQYLCRFDEGKLTQVVLEFTKNVNPKIYLQNHDVSSVEGLQYLLSQEQSIQYSTDLWLFPELGLVINQDLKQFFFFDQSLRKYWENIHRPRTSW